MKKRKNGCIINVTSVAGRISSSPLGSYAASKFAMEALSEALAQETKSFNIRVAIVQPGIIDTSMARSMSERTQEDTSTYSHTPRMANLFAASLQQPASPALVGEKIRDIIENETDQLRHPIGPDAEPFLQWRAGMTDEEWVDLGAADDETWYAAIEQDFGVNARPQT
jgi:NAD(P)-dependent dehydrogenase (short-subunit alcohol dehydrogenase family)